MSKRALITQFLGLSCLAVSLLSSSCATSRGPVSRQAPERQLYKWYDDGGPGQVTVRISLSDQIAEFKRGDREIGWCYVATGKEGHDTRPGSYTITEKIEDKYSNRYGWMEDEYGNVTDSDARFSDRVPEGMVYVPAPMPYWMRLTSYGVGMHGGIIPQPGEPASHGCIRLPKKFVPLVFDSVKVGTPVTITNAPSKRLDPEPPEIRYDRPVRPYGPVPSPANREWTRGNGAQEAESVTYRNGLPVFYR